MSDWRVAVAVAALVMAGIAGCTNEISGTPIAGPSTGATTVPPRTLPPRTSGAPTPTLIPTPNGAATTCQEYQAIDEAGRLAVITAIGDNGNSGVGLNPKLWVSIADALCSFVEPQTLVKDVLTGKGFG